MSRVWRSFEAVYARRDFRKILVEFCTEVAVLWFVFPLVDSIIQHGKPMTSFMLAGFAVAILFLGIAGILAKMIGEED